MRCSSSSCDHCNPPRARAKQALKSALTCIDFNAFKDAEQVLGWNTDEYWQFHDKPWFQAILAAYNAGVNAARKEIEDELELLGD